MWLSSSPIHKCTSLHHPSNGRTVWASYHTLVNSIPGLVSGFWQRLPRAFGCFPCPYWRASPFCARYSSTLCRQHFFCFLLFLSLRQVLPFTWDPPRMPSQTISVYHSSDGVMHDVQFSFETRFHFTPWTFSSRSPMTDVEYADDTVLVARTQLTLHRFLHSLQHEASKHANLSIHLSPHVTPTFPLLLPTLHGNRWFGCSNPTPAVSQISWGLRSCKCIFCTGLQLSLLASDRRVSLPLSRLHNPSLPSRRKLQVYARIVLAIFLYGSGSQVFTPARITRLNSLHYKVLRQIFQVESSYYHRVLHPSQEDGSNDTRSPSPTVMPSPDTQSAYFRPAIALPRSSSSAFWSLRA